MQAKRFLKFWHVPLAYLAATLIFASSIAMYVDPSFLGPYLLLLAEFLAGVFILRYETGHRRFVHLAVAAIALYGTFVVLVSLTTCSPAHLPANAPCSLSEYLGALIALTGNFVLAAVIAVVLVPIHFLVRSLRTGSHQSD